MGAMHTEAMELQRDGAKSATAQQLFWPNLVSSSPVHWNTLEVLGGPATVASLATMCTGCIYT